MKTLFVCLAAILPLGAGQPQTALAPVSLYTHFIELPSATILSAVQSEVGSIMAPMGLTFQWVSLSDYDSRRVSVELAVISFKGRCDVSGLTARSINPGALGWTHISDGIILPFADIDCSAVREFLQKELYFMRGGDREKVFGRALGRVLAHELYHIFANTRHHGVDGVGRECYSVQDLMAPEFQFEAHEFNALLNSKAHSALANAAAASEEDPLRF